MRALGLLFLVVGCAHTRPLVLICPQEGGPPWHELTSAHFNLRTDVPVEDARAIIARGEVDLARVKAALSDWIGAGPDPAVIHLVVFARKEDLRAALSSDDELVERWDEDESRAILLTARRALHEGALRELVQRTLRWRFQRLPDWVHEGLAEYLKTLQVSDEGIVIGARPPEIDPASWQRRNFADPAPLTSADVEEFHSTSWYRAGSWALVHWLDRPERRDDFRAFLRELEKGAKPDDSFHRYFGEPAHLEPLGPYIDELLKQPSTRTIPVSSELQSGEIVVHPLNEANLHLLWHAIGPASLSERQMEDSLAHGGPSPQHCVNRAVAALNSDHVAVEDELKAAIALDPTNPRWRHYRTALRMVIAENDVERPERFRALGAEVAAMVRDSPRASALNNAAWYYAKLKQPQIGLPLVRRSLEMQPDDPHALDTLAELLLETGDAEGALAAESASYARRAEIGGVPQNAVERLDHFRRAAQR